MILNVILTSGVVIAGFYFSMKCFSKIGEHSQKSMMEPIPIEKDED